ncbi:unnamed protein product, partial [Sphacelaria rigidula]
RQIVIYAGHVTRKHDERLPSIVMSREMVGGEKKIGQSVKRVQHRVPECYCTLGIDAMFWPQIAQDGSGWYRVVEEGA